VPDVAGRQTGSNEFPLINQLQLRRRQSHYVQE